MMTITFYDYGCAPAPDLLEAAADFLYQHLEQYGDPLEDIRKALAYALKDPEGGSGGFICLGCEGDDIVGAVVTNRTGMEGYIPENILVYVAVHRDRRGLGFGKRILTEAVGRAAGGIALHVEADNPAFFLYRDLGFTHKYLEMRLERKEVF